jgi:hypothetical protein
MAVTQFSTTDVYDALLTTTLRNYRNKLEDNIFGELPLLYWLSQGDRKKTIDGGTFIMVPLLYGENTTVQLFEGYDLLNVTPQEGITMAQYNWKSMGVSISISREQERKNSGKHKLIDLLEAKTMQAEKSMQWYLNDLLHGRFSSFAKTFTGGDTTNTVDSVGGALLDGTGKGFNSLDHIVRSLWGYYNPTSPGGAVSTVVGGIVSGTTSSNTTGGTYSDLKPTSGALGVSAYTNPWWLNYSIPGFQRLQRGQDGGVMGAFSTDTELTWAGSYSGNSGLNIVSVMRSMYNRISNGSDHPDLILSGQDAFEAYEAALVPQERFTDTKLGDAGFQNLKFKGATMIFDHGINVGIPTAAPTAAAPATPMYMLNSKYFQWTVDTETDFFVTPFYRPVNQVARTAQILLMANLVCSNRSRQGVISLANFGATGYAGA